MKSIGELQQEVADWADEVLPRRKFYTTAAKLMMEEIPEWLMAPDDPLEYADIVILVLDLAYQKGIDIEEAVERKMAINRTRRWQVDELGVATHIGERNEPD